MFDVKTDSNDLFRMSPELLAAYVLWSTEQIIEPTLVANRTKLRQRRALAETLYLKKKGAK